MAKYYDTNTAAGVVDLMIPGWRHKFKGKLQGISVENSVHQMGTKVQFTIFIPDTASSTVDPLEIYRRLNHVLDIVIEGESNDFGD